MIWMLPVVYLEPTPCLFYTIKGGDFYIEVKYNLIFKQSRPLRGSCSICIKF